MAQPIPLLLRPTSSFQTDPAGEGGAQAASVIPAGVFAPHPAGVFGCRRAHTEAPPWTPASVPGTHPASCPTGGRRHGAAAAARACSLPLCSIPSSLPPAPPQQPLRAVPPCCCCCHRLQSSSSSSSAAAAATSSQDIIPAEFSTCSLPEPPPAPAPQPSTRRLPAPPQGGLPVHPQGCLPQGCLPALPEEGLPAPTWKYFPHTRQAYTLTGLSVTEQHFSKSKSRFCAGAARRRGCQVGTGMCASRRRRRRPPARPLAPSAVMQLPVGPCCQL